MDCVKALVTAGADVSTKNHAGHDAVFLAERTAWNADAEERGNEPGEQYKQQGEEGDDKPEASPGRAVVEWLLSCENGSSLETPVGEAASAEAMDGVEETTS